MTVSSARAVTRWVKRALPFAVVIASYGVSLAQSNLATNSPSAPLDEAVGWTTNGPIIFSVHKLTMPKTFFIVISPFIIVRIGSFGLRASAHRDDRLDGLLTAQLMLHQGRRY